MKQSVFIDRARSVLSDNAGTRWLPRQLSGARLDESRLGLVRAGEQRVFARAQRRQLKDWHVVVLMDISGSMRDEKLEMAVRATHALWWALVQAGASVDVAMFNCTLTGVKPRVLADLTEFGAQAYEQSHDSAAGGANHDAYAVHRARLRLLESGHAGKVILVLSDGEPACGGCAHPGSVTPLASGIAERCKLDRRLAAIDGTRGPEWESLVAEVARARRAGIDVLAVGIRSKSAQQIYGERNAVRVADLADLYKGMSSLVERTLRRG